MNADDSDDDGSEPLDSEREDGGSDSMEFEDLPYPRGRRYQ